MEKLTRSKIHKMKRLQLKAKTELQSDDQLNQQRLDAEPQTDFALSQLTTYS